MVQSGGQSFPHHKCDFTGMPMECLKCHCVWPIAFPRGGPWLSLCLPVLLLHEGISEGLEGVEPEKELTQM